MFRGFPTDTTNLLNKYLANLERGKSLNPIERFDLYASFSSKLSNLSPTKDFFSLPTERVGGILLKHSSVDIVLGYLGILTAKKVLPIWNRIWTQKTLEVELNGLVLPEQIIDTTQRILLNDMTIAENISELSTTYNTATAITHWLSSDIGNAFDTAYNTFVLIVDGLEMLEPYTAADETITQGWCDFAASAVKAYSIADKTATRDVLEYDEEKITEFWFWWLTEAIPQAWELAQSTRNTANL